ncbi:CLCB protein, partial [Columbina picui]|nr:CLCB protein [Columbina picui]
MADDFGFFSSSEGAGAEEDPAAAFLAQQESEIAGIENDEGFGPTDGESAGTPAGQAAPPEPGERRAGRSACGDWAPSGPRAGRAPPGCPPAWFGFPVGCTVSPAGDGRRAAPQWAGDVVPCGAAYIPARTVRGLCLVSKGLMSQPQDGGIADKAFYQQPDADVIGYVASEEAFLKESKEETPGSEWEKVAQLCDFNPKSSKQSKDVSRMRSVLISLKQ